MPLSDVGVLLAIGVSAPALAVLLRRGGLRGRALLGAWWVGLYGLLLLISMVAHSLDVLSRVWVGTGHGGEPFPYDFRAYALLLLGGVLTTLGVRMLRFSLGRTRTRDLAAAWGTTAVTLVVVVPLIPIQTFFALPLTIFGVVTLAATGVSSPAAVAASPAQYGYPRTAVAESQ